MSPLAPASADDRELPSDRLAVASLRAAFDRSFAELPRNAPHDLRDFVLVRVASVSCALPAVDLRGIEHDLRILPVPSTIPALLGIAGVSGAIVPVFHLGSLLGYPATDASQPASRSFACIALAGEEQATSLGLCFDELLAFARVEPRQLFSAPATYSPGNVLVAETLYKEIDLHSLVATLTGDTDRSKTAAEDPHG
jgi:chemotaxis signal transduction protein